MATPKVPQPPVPPVDDDDAALTPRKICDELDTHIVGQDAAKRAVAIAPLDGTVWLLREAEPRLLIALSPDLARIVSVRPLDAAAGFDDAMDRDGRLDVSGIAVAAAGFWIVSDRGRRMFLLARDGGAGPALSWPLARRHGDDPDLLSDAEGVAWDPGRNMLFVVSDAKKKSGLVSYALTD